MLKLATMHWRLLRKNCVPRIFGFVGNYLVHESFVSDLSRICIPNGVIGFIFIASAIA